MLFSEAVKARRSQYALDSEGVDTDAVLEALRGIAGDIPSSYNSQSARMVFLTGDDHRLFWSITADALREKVGDPQRFARTEAKLEGFAKAAGTILFYEIDAKTEALIAKYPSYAAMFPQWAEHGNAMLQFAAWTKIADMGLGANIQHYNPLVDARVAEAFGIPDGYRLVAQMVFGRVVEPAGPKDKLPGSEIVVRGHAKL